MLHYGLERCIFFASILYRQSRSLGRKEAAYEKRYKYTDFLNPLKPSL